MRRRHITCFVLAAIMLVPALAVALPGREELGMRQTEPQTLITSFNLSPTDAFGKVTPVLMEGRQYRFVVRGTWKPTAASGNFADAGFETSNSWGTANRTGRGLGIGNTNYASPGNTTLQFDPVNHRYEITYLGRGIQEIARIVDTNYDDNSTAPGSPNGLTVELYQLSKVKWVLDLSGPFPPSPVPNPYVKQTISPGPINPGTVPEVGVPGVGVPGLGVPVLGHLRVRDTGPLLCLTVQPSGGSEVTAACAFDPGIGQGDIVIPIGGNEVVPSTTVCSGGCTIVPGGPVSPIPLPSFVVEGGVPPGSRLLLELTWEADRSKLWKTLLNDGTQDNQYMAPFDPRGSDRNWFLTEASAGRLALRITASLIGADGQPVGGAPIFSAGVPGVGQLVESMFETKVIGR